MGSTVTVGVSMKMYFGHRRALEWCTRVADLARAQPAVASGDVRLFILPTFVQLVPTLATFAGTRVEVGVQDVAVADVGAFTGEVSAAEVAEVGATLAEVGHAERRRLFGETDVVVAEKAAAALRNGLTPVVCLGEAERTSTATAVAVVRGQLASALRDAVPGPVVVAYEPVWAIGAPAPAPVEHIAAVCTALRHVVAGLPHRTGSAVIYGGSAGPGLLTELHASVDGLFLGRSAHDPAALAAVLDEAVALTEAVA